MDGSYSAEAVILPKTIPYLADTQDHQMPAIGPGRIYVFECGTAAFSPLHTAALGCADAVLYEPALAPLVSGNLPIGVYAEKLPPTESAGPAVSARAVRLAADGWSVVQLVEARRFWRERLSSAAETATAPYGDGLLGLLAIGTVAADRYQQWEAQAAELALFVAALHQDELLALTFAPPAVRQPALGHAFTANGLAG